MKDRALLRTAAILAALFFLVAAGAWTFFHDLGAPIPPRPARIAAARLALPGGGALAEHFRVRPGEGIAAIAGRMRAEGIVHRALPVRLVARWEGWDRKVVPGWYRARPGEPVRDLLRRMRLGEIEKVRLTIPEGWELSRILAATAESTWVPLDSLRVLAGNRDWLGRHEVPGPGLEGYLFPDTYLLPRGESPVILLEQMLRPGIRLWRDSLRTEAEGLGLDRAQVWTLASMIEREAARNEERARISAVFWNRLRRGMRLESDPTVQFALGRPPGSLSLSDLEIDSPYNTYRVPGLPPGPICSPGRASLLAALHPQPGCNELFFVARGDGSHVFSLSLAQHDRARRAIALAQGRR